MANLQNQMGTPTMGGAPNQPPPVANYGMSDRMQRMPMEAMQQMPAMQSPIGHNLPPGMQMGMQAQPGSSSPQQGGGFGGGKNGSPSPQQGKGGMGAQGKMGGQSGSQPVNIAALQRSLQGIIGNPATNYMRP